MLVVQTHTASHHVLMLFVQTHGLSPRSDACCADTLCPLTMSDDICVREAAAELREEFLTLAQELDDFYGNCNKFKVAGSAAAVAGGG